MNLSPGQLVKSTVILVFAMLLCSCQGAHSEPKNQDHKVHVRQIPAQPDGLEVLLNPEIQRSIPHDTDSFTQGLLAHRGYLYESTGRPKKSKVLRLNMTTGEAEDETRIHDSYFGEGLAYLDKKFFQLTWTSGVCLQYNENLELEKQLFYGTQGWGLTVDPNEKLLVFSDGTDEIRFLDPRNLVTKRRIKVTDGRGRPVSYINELEWVQGEIWANIWTSDIIARIDPNTGKVKAWIKLEELVQKNQTNDADVLNGIAYDEAHDQLFLTGKLWSKIYIIDKVTEVFFNSNGKSPQEL